MTLQDYSLTAFTILNGARIFAYFPQIICVCRDRTGASSVSTMTWGTFCSANLGTVFYALTIGDRVIAGVFVLNAIACTVILALIIRKRMTYARSNNQAADQSYSRQILRYCQSTLAGQIARLRRAAEDRIAARHAGDRWSDAVERAINEDWRDYRCGRLRRSLINEGSR
jgi:hypothetical protein